MIIAIDFDGTIVEDAYPKIGKPQLFAFQTLKELHKEGHRLILWTCRKGMHLEEAVAFCRSQGIEFYAVNSNYPEDVLETCSSPKIVADAYIDDRNLGGFPGWSEVWRVLGSDREMKRPTATFRNFLSKVVGSFTGL